MQTLTDQEGKERRNDYKNMRQVRGQNQHESNSKYNITHVLHK